MRKLSKREKNLVAIAIFMIVMVLAVGSTYAFWTTTQVQDDVNEIDTTCLKIELLNQNSSEDTAEKTKGINLEKAFPISDEEGLKEVGYTFTVKNNCNIDVNYDVNIESLKFENEEFTPKQPSESPESQESRETSSPYLQSEYIKTVIDSSKETKPYKVLSGYTDVSKENLTDKDNVYEYKNLLHNETVKANGSKTHNLKMWVTSDAPDTQMLKHYQGKIVIYGWLGNSNPYDINVVGD